MKIKMQKQKGWTVPETISVFDLVKRGQLFYVTFENEINLPKKLGGHKLTKKVSLVARTKINYKNTKAYFKKIAVLPIEPKRTNEPKKYNPIKPIQENYLYQNKKGEYLFRFYGMPSIGNKSQYYWDGNPISVDELLEKGVAPSLIGLKGDGTKKEKPICIYVKVANVVSLNA